MFSRSCRGVILGSKGEMIATSGIRVTGVGSISGLQALIGMLIIV